MITVPIKRNRYSADESGKITRSLRLMLEDMKIDLNVYIGLFQHCSGGWKASVAEFPRIRVKAKTYGRAVKALSNALDDHLNRVWARCNASQEAGGLIIGLRHDGKNTIWIGSMKNLRQAFQIKDRTRNKHRDKVRSISKALGQTMRIDRKREYERQVACGEIWFIDGIPVYVGPARSIARGPTKDVRPSI
jgi:hypothetical protein